MMSNSLHKCPRLQSCCVITCPVEDARATWREHHADACGQLRKGSARQSEGEHPKDRELPSNIRSMEMTGVTGTSGDDTTSGGDDDDIRSGDGGILDRSFICVTGSYRCTEPTYQTCQNSPAGPTWWDNMCHVRLSRSGLRWLP